MKHIGKEKIYVLPIMALLIIFCSQAHAQETSASFTGGAVKVGYDNRSCDASSTGAVRYSSALKCPELCDGTDWLNTSCSDNTGATLPTSQNPCYGNGTGTCLFVTDDLGFYNGNLGGLSGGDSKCATKATNGGLTGTYKAVISSSTTNAKDRFTVTYPVVSPNGLIIEDTNLWAGALEHAPAFDQNGAPNVGVTLFWTGSDSAGVKTSNHCTNWTSSSSGVNGTVGRNDMTNGEWIEDNPGFSPDPCNQNKYLYCMLATGL